MAVIKGYFDDSAGEGMWTVAGYVGNDDQWRRFETLWPKALERHHVPYFHMNEMNDPNGLYGKWYPSKDHQDEIIPFFQDLFMVIQSCVLNAFYSTVKEQDLNEFNAKYKASVDPYALATYAVILQIGRTYLGEIVEVVVDHATKVCSKLQLAKQYAKSDRRVDNIGITDKIQPIPLVETLNFIDVIEIQAADFLAWEMRKYHLVLQDWIDDLPINQREQWREHFKGWPRNKPGNVSVSRRRSGDELFSCQQIRVGFGITRLYAAPMRLGAVFGLLTSLRWYNLFKCALQCTFGFIATKLPSGLSKPLGLLFLCQLFMLWF
jgi:hypothetical protein